MGYTKKTGSFPSSNGINDIGYYVYIPDRKIKGLMQISHGMCEYIERYEPHISFFTEQGYLVFGNDHLGHKGSVTSNADLGYMGHKDGWKYIYEDVHKMTMLMREEYPELPIFLYGHSMGSFVARSVIGAYGKDYAGAIICGTGGTNKMAGMGIKAIHLVRTFKGERHRSEMLTNLSFGAYNKRYDSVRTDQDWLTREESVVDAYRKDPYCSFTFTAAGYEDLLSILQHVSKDAWYDSVPEELPLFVISGDMDPVGDFGEGVKEVFRRLKERPHSYCEMKLYKDMRHELFNEIGHEEVYSDVLNFMNAHGGE